MASEFFQNLLQGSIVIGVLGGIAILYWSKLTKQTFGQVIKKIFSTKFFVTEEPIEENKQQEEIKQVWQERRTIM